MLVSAISENFYNASNVFNKNINACKKDTFGETSFNSLNPYYKKSFNSDRTRLYYSINEWKNFCHKQILSGKLDVIA